MAYVQSSIYRSSRIRSKWAHVYVPPVSFLVNLSNLLTCWSFSPNLYPRSTNSFITYSLFIELGVFISDKESLKSTRVNFIRWITTYYYECFFSFLKKIRKIAVIFAPYSMVWIIMLNATIFDHQYFYFILFLLLNKSNTFCWQNWSKSITNVCKIIFFVDIQFR